MARLAGACRQSGLGLARTGEELVHGLHVHACGFGYSLLCFAVDEGWVCDFLLLGSERGWRCGPGHDWGGGSVAHCEGLCDGDILHLLLDFLLLLLRAQVLLPAVHARDLGRVLNVEQRAEYAGLLSTQSWQTRHPRAPSARRCALPCHTSSKTACTPSVHSTACLCHAAEDTAGVWRWADGRARDAGLHALTCSCCCASLRSS